MSQGVSQAHSLLIALQSLGLGALLANYVVAGGPSFVARQAFWRCW